MANTPEHPATAPAPRRLEDVLAARRKEITYGLFVAAVLISLIPIIVLVKFGLSGALGLLGWGLLITFVAWFGAAAHASGGWGTQLSDVDRTRITLLAVGGLVGLSTTILGLALPFTAYSEVFTGGATRWRQNPWPLVWTGAAIIGGFLLVFLSLQLTRGVERTSGVMRRFLYAYNAGLGCFLLVAILGLLNVLSYFNYGPFAFFSKRIDYTASGIYTLSDRMRNFLTNLKEPVKVYVLMSQGDPLTRDVLTLLENARTVTSEISWEALSRDRNRTDIEALLKKYPFADTLGLLVVYGKEAKETADFIERKDLFQVDNPNRFTPPTEKKRESGYDFLGEQMLLKAMTFLAEGKTKTVVYFTQSEGEMSLTEPGRRGVEEDLTVLKERLDRHNYEVRELRFGPSKKEVPGDASAVVIVRPTQEFSADALKALRDYMNGGRGKKGKLLVLADVVVQRDGAMVRTGLENFLTSFNVRLGNDRVLCRRGRYPTEVFALPNPRSNSDVARAFATTPMQFDDVRTVEAVPAGGGRGASEVAETLYFALPQLEPWAETDLGANPRALVEDMRKPENLERARAKIEGKFVSIAATVTESAGNMPRVPGHEGLLKEVPRLVVFGDAGWVSSEALRGPRGQLNVDLFAACLSWLKGRPDIGKSEEGKRRKQYLLNVPPDTATRIKYLPLGLMLLAVLGLGAGVWVVRRR